MLEDLKRFKLLAYIAVHYDYTANQDSFDYSVV